MPHRVTCPSCGRALSVPDDVKTGQLSCPRCLAKFDNPAAASRTVQEPPPLTVTSAETPPACPLCGEHVEPAWQFCPNCQAALRGSNRGRVVRIVDEDVRRDTKRTSIVLILLAVLGGLGLVYFIWVGTGYFPGAGGGWEVLFAVLIGVPFLGLITTGIMFYRTRYDPSQRGIGRVVVGTLAMIGGLLVISCLFGLVVIAFFFVACLSGRNLFG